MAGRRPKPTRLKELTGNPGRRPLNRREPVAVGRAMCPAHLDAIAREEWARVGPQHEGKGFVGSVDYAAQAGYCASYSVWVRAERGMASVKGVLVRRGKSGDVEAMPFIKIAREALDQMRKFMGEFGMTPSSRSRLIGNAGDDKKEDNPFADLAAEGHAGPALQ